jgi:23S rRNA pseudouridine1911/1915/1917 synthase
MHYTAVWGQVVTQTITIRIPEQLANARLDRALAALAAARDGAWQGLSRARLQALIKQGLVVRLGDEQTTPASSAPQRGASQASAPVKAGETYQITLPKPEPAKPQAEAISLQIVYEDADVIVINKPPGMVVHPAAGNHSGTLVNALLAHCGASLSGIGGVARPGIVHRLDKDTSGLMIAAKHDAAHQGLSRQFADRTLSRVYRALVWGVPHPAKGSVAGNIGRHPRYRQKMAVVARGGKVAETSYRVLQTFGTLASLVECRLATGRTHQIRVHMGHIRHPLVGDQLYGGRQGRAGPVALRDFKRQALHAAELKFVHPTTDKVMEFKADMPADLQRLMAALKQTPV